MSVLQGEAITLRDGKLVDRYAFHLENVEGHDDATLLDEQRIRRLIERWAVWRDAGDWERFATVWHDNGWMTATWFQGPAGKFIEVSKAGFEKGVSILQHIVPLPVSDLHESAEQRGKS